METTTLVASMLACGAVSAVFGPPLVRGWRYVADRLSIPLLAKAMRAAGLCASALTIAAVVVGLVGGPVVGALAVLGGAGSWLLMVPVASLLLVISQARRERTLGLLEQRLSGAQDDVAGVPLASTTARERRLSELSDSLVIGSLALSDRQPRSCDAAASSRRPAAPSSDEISVDVMDGEIFDRELRKALQHELELMGLLDHSVSESPGASARAGVPTLRAPWLYREALRDCSADPERSGVRTEDRSANGGRSRRRRLVASQRGLGPVRRRFSVHQPS